ncbi:MAG: YdcF family protein [Candidatus Azobacteroides sp.]|nr:YdcF family protein [Candidatus Azobacteroides sp.]
MSVWLANYKINSATRYNVYENINAVPYNKVGLVLGTSKYLRANTLNPYFKYRIDAAANLFKAGKISYIVVSGDNRHHSYNEPEDMKKALMEQGIPKEKIYLDYAGFRTLDSVVRINMIFGQSSFTVISQKFHNERAVFIAENYGLNAVGYNARDVEIPLGFKVKVREIFARVKVFIDLLIGKDPKFLGEPIEIR